MSKVHRSSSSQETASTDLVCRSVEQGRTVAEHLERLQPQAVEDELAAPERLRIALSAGQRQGSEYGV